MELSEQVQMRAAKRMGVHLLQRQADKVVQPREEKVALQPPVSEGGLQGGQRGALSGTVVVGQGPMDIN